MQIRTFIELVKKLSYKLRMMGVHTNWPEIVFGDNINIVNGMSILEFNISKNQLGICYLDVREASSAGIRKVGFLKVTYNIANCLNKILSGVAK